MELHQLRMFTKAAELQNFTRAAAAMSVSQPAVSQRVAMLERELGVSLFERSGRGVTLTVAGRHMYDYARKALELLDTACHEIKETPDVVAGTIHIASCPIPAEALLPGLLAVFRRTYPQVREFVQVVNSGEASKAVATGDADLAFTVVPPAENQLTVRVVACHELLLVVSPEHPLAGCSMITTDQLRNQQFIMRETGSGTRQCTEQALTDAGVSPNELNIALESNSDNTIRLAVKQGTGLAFLSPSTVQDDIDQNRLVAVKTEVHARLNIYLVSDPQHMPAAAVRAFISLVA